MSSEAIDKELFELCEQVYEQTGWDDTRDFYHEEDDFDNTTGSFKRNGKWVVVERKRADYNIPLYTSDYILDKLRTSHDMSIKVGEKLCTAYSKFSQVAETSDSPLKSLLKLTIALKEAGEL